MKHLVCLGGFKNQREVFEWEGQTLELDETQYEWGTLYEIECETVSVFMYIHDGAIQQGCFCRQNLLAFCLAR